MSILSNIAKGLKAFFSNPVVKEVETIAIPLEETLFPSTIPLISGIMVEVGKVEALSASVGMQTGSGAQKLAMVTQTAESVFNDYEAARGVKINPAGKETIINAVVAILNALPATA